MYGYEKLLNHLLKNLYFFFQNQTNITYIFQNIAVYSPNKITIYKFNNF